MALIPDLPASTSVASTDVFVKDTGSTTQKITAPNLANELVAIAVGSAAWLDAPTNKLNLRRFGTLRQLTFRDYVPSASTFYTLDANDRPGIVVTGLCRWRNTGGLYYPALVTVSNNGSVSASYFNPNTSTSTAISNGTLTGAIFWIK